MIITTDTGYSYIRVSRWIKIICAEVTPRNSLYPYGDIYGHDDNRSTVYLFRHKNKKYALGQFMRLTSPEFFIDKDGKTSFLSGYDATTYYKPLLIEIHPDGEYIRLYQEV